ncbi:hypothetical protein BZG36_00570 [Bifiguratus adelaidae]|uniref:Protein SSH4 n=1 Tax=Bifiguratus adelaidae TaxID=1938954 RepID=A0A261Y7C1_9FUNG|nr:hypothetical protein BZG36_00570 [Bifiguratus adelaidae]
MPRLPSPNTPAQQGRSNSSSDSTPGSSSFTEALRRIIGNSNFDALQTQTFILSPEPESEPSWSRGLESSHLRDLFVLEPSHIRDIRRLQREEQSNIDMFSAGLSNWPWAGRGGDESEGEDDNAAEEAAVSYSLSIPMCHSPARIPAYLMRTNYLRHLHRSHRDSTRPLPTMRNSQTPSTLDRGSKSSKNKKIKVDDENVSTRTCEADCELPTALNRRDRAVHLEISADGLGVVFVGQHKSDRDAATVRANRPIPPQTGIFYFEMEVVSKGVEGFIGLGVCAKDVELARLPGWEPDSYGYHGDDGQKFSSRSEKGKEYGPKYTKGDVIGCGVNFVDRSIFYTKNGKHLGTAFENIIKRPLYPCIGMRSTGEEAKINFGQRKFKFDISRYVDEEMLRIQESIKQLPLTTLENPTVSMNRLVFSYLVHLGFVDTAKAFVKRMDQDSQLAGCKILATEQDGAASSEHTLLPETELDMERRKSIRLAIQDGEIDRALAMLNEHYPDLSTSNSLIRFRVLSLKFVQLVSIACMAGSSPQSDDDIDMNDDTAVNTWQLSSKPTKKGPAVYADVVAFGQNLQAEYGEDARPEVQQGLLEIFSLLAYNDPKKSIMGHLFDSSHRMKVAEDLNSAILESDGRPYRSSLEQIYTQSEVVLDECIKEGVGKAAFVNLERDILSM